MGGTEIKIAGRWAIRSWFVGFVLLFSVVLATPAAHAAPSFTVNSTLDEHLSPASTGQCVSTPSGVCTLRAAVEEINTISGSGQIVIPPGTYTLSLGPIVIAASPAISGTSAASTIIDGGNVDRVFELAGTGNAYIQKVTAQHGLGTTTNSVAKHGHGGCIHNHGQLTLVDSVVRFCAAKPGWGGGAITNASSATLTLTNDSITNGASDSRGGGLENLHDATLTNVTINTNQASAAGGVLNSGTLALTNSTVSDNVATTGGAGNDGGGGILNVGGGAATINSSTISGNQAQGAGGGGLQNDGTGSSAATAMTVVNSTIANNSAAGFGGGVDNFDLDPSPPNKPVTTLSSSTVVGNHAGASGGGLQQFRAIYNVRNTLVAGNSASTSNPDCTNGSPDTYGSQGYNLIGNATGCSGFGGTGDLLNMNPLVGPLAQNGGPTKTIALLSGSPAIGAGNPATPGSGGSACPATDQRGLPRGGPTGRCDIGAFEVQPPAPPPALSGLGISPRKASIAGRVVNGHCVKPTKQNRSHKHCRRPIKLRVSFTLSVAANVGFTLQLQSPGRRVNGRCVKPTKKNKKHAKCVRLIRLRGTITRAGKAGANSFTLKIVLKGKIGGKRLGPGTYELVATPTANGSAGPQRTVTFKLLP